MVGHRSAAAAARPAIQLRPEGRGLRPAGLRRPADDRSRAHRAAAVGPGAAGLHGGRRRHQPVRPADRGLQGRQTRQRLRDLCDRLQVGRPQPERRADRRARPAGPRLPRRSSRRTCATSRSGVKTEPFRGVTANFTVFNTEHQGLPGAGRQRAASACCAAISPTPRRCACAAPSSTAARSVNAAALVLRRRRLHRRHVRVVSRRAAAARGNRRPAGQGHLGLGAARASPKWARLVRRRVRTRPASALRPQRASSSAASTPAIAPSFSSSASASKYLVVDGYSPAQCPRRLPVGGRLDALRLVAQSARQELLRAADGGAGQHRALCRAARRSANRRRDAAGRLWQIAGVCVGARCRCVVSPCSASPPRRR